MLTLVQTSSTFILCVEDNQRTVSALLERLNLPVHLLRIYCNLFSELFSELYSVKKTNRIINSKVFVREKRKRDTENQSEALSLPTAKRSHAYLLWAIIRNKCSVDLLWTICFHLGRLKDCVWYSLENSSKYPKSPPSSLHNPNPNHSFIV